MAIQGRRVGRWLLTPARARHVYPVAAALGLTSFLVVYGWGQLIGSNAYWQMPEQDERMALMGYRYFLQGPWHWPVFLNDAVDVPYRKSIALLDCIPIWALANKVVSTIVPPWKSFSAYAYLGLWHGLAYALQPCLGVACLRALGHRSWRTALVTAVFFVALPTWIFRYPHAGLSAHWILIWAFYLYLRTPPGAHTARGLGLAKLAQLSVAMLVTPYHAAMSLPVFVASLFRARDRRTLAVWLPLGLLTVVVAAWFAGYFAGDKLPPQWGFRWESANLLGWLIPQRSGIVGDAQWIASVNGTPWQYEGYAYLGLGVLLLLAGFVPHAGELGSLVRRHPALFVVVAAAAVFALSNHVFFGSHELFSYPIPRLLRWIPGQFRAPGRFVWIPTYALVLFLLHWAFTRQVSWRAFGLVALAAALQVVDATGDWRLQHTKTRGPHGAMLDRGGWRPLVHAHEAVWLLPPYGCVHGQDAPRLDLVSMEIQLLASERALPINGTYSTRATRRCEAEARAWASLAPQPNTLYVLLPEARAISERLQAGGASCAAFDEGRVCSTSRLAIERAIRASVLREPP